MKRASAGCAIILLTALSACSPKVADNCKQHTGDGLCADPGKNPDGSIAVKH